MACMHNHQSLISTTLACHVMPTYTLHRISPCSMHWTLSNVKFPHNPLTPPARAKSCALLQAAPPAKSTN